ncbi:MAG TPA: hypothetical protein VMV98_05165 [Acidobacteriaceae bacterium]|nr:hypothetical protein [Acidobacteriaceae bacterium]
MILAQVERIVESPAFRNSKRYPRFLRFIVEQALFGHADRLKERLVGIEVFDRTPEYDLATDPIVRVAAGELRKRLAQYYIDNSHDNELRIHLQPGSYVPEFQLPRKAVAVDKALHLAESDSIPPPEVPHIRTSAPWHRRKIALVVATFGITLSLGIYLVLRTSPIDKFWRPFLESPNSPLICLGDGGHLLPDGDAEGPGLRTGLNSYDHLALGDVEALNRISTILARRGKAATISNSRSTTFADLCKQPVILIGGSPNKWTMRYMQLLRYQLIANFSPGVNGILDRENPSRLRWAVDFNAPYDTIPKEYAIVARFHNPTTGQPTLIAAGVGANGEVAAAEFLTTPAYLREFLESAPRGWEDRNLEIILETEMINGTSGPPHVITTHMW